MPRPMEAWSCPRAEARAEGAKGRVRSGSQPTTQATGLRYGGDEPLRPVHLLQCASDRNDVFRGRPAAAFGTERDDAKVVAQESASDAPFLWQAAAGGALEVLAGHKEVAGLMIAAVQQEDHPLDFLRGHDALSVILKVHTRLADFCRHRPPRYRPRPASWASAR
eukprot:scaffold1876_cov257-Pinguiococcus_pyrenoidosus.AAC.7